MFKRALQRCANGRTWSVRKLGTIRKRGLAPECSGTSPMHAQDVGCLSPFSDGLLPLGRWLATAAVLVSLQFAALTAHGQEASNRPLTLPVPTSLGGGPEAWTTCFVRIIVVLGLLRQALGTQQLPPSQVLTSIALFMTLLVMSPVWKESYDEAVVPYTNRQISLGQAWDRGVAPMRRFMSLQIQRTGNEDDVLLFMEFDPTAPAPESYDDVPLTALLPAFMLSELKTAFLIGFQIYLPFLILDIVVSSVMISMGMLMLPPVLVSLPFKLLLFVLVDGWHLMVGMLLESFQPFT
jgi:flagellar biosynthesis protein FliP